MSETEHETPEPDETPDVDRPGDDEELEAEEDGEPGEPEPAPELEPETAPSGEPESPTDKKRMQAAQRAVQTYAKKIGEIFEEQSQELLPCPLCGDTVWPGFVHLADAGQMPDDVKNATMAFLGYARERDYPQAPNVSACRACAALGKVATGSLVAGKETIVCPACNGYGYTPPPGSPSNGTEHDHTGVTAPTMIPTGAGIPDTDPSGEPRLLPDGRENPNYGKWPQYKIPVEPWGTTAGLTVQDAAAS